MQERHPQVVIHGHHHVDSVQVLDGSLVIGVGAIREIGLELGQDGVVEVILRIPEVGGERNSTLVDIEE